MAGDQPRDFRNWRDVLRARRIDRVLGHLRKQGLAGVLHDGAATIPANDAQTHAAVVQRPGKHDADHPLTVGVRRTAEQRVDRGTMTAFLRSTAELDAAGLEQQLTVARGHVDSVAFDRFVVLGDLRFQDAAAAEDAGKQAVTDRKGMDHDEEG